MQLASRVRKLRIIPKEDDSDRKLYLSHKSSKTRLSMSVFLGRSHPATCSTLHVTWQTCWSALTCDLYADRTAARLRLKAFVGRQSLRPLTHNASRARGETSPSTTSKSGLPAACRSTLIHPTPYHPPPSSPPLARSGDAPCHSIELIRADRAHLTVLRWVRGGTAAVSQV